MKWRSVDSLPTKLGTKINYLNTKTFGTAILTEDGWLNPRGEEVEIKQWDIWVDSR